MIRRLLFACTFQVLFSVAANAACPVGQTCAVQSWVNITDPLFGATGNGSTDDATAIQAAVDYAFAHNLNAVYCPSGNYKIGTTIYLIPPGGANRPNGSGAAISGNQIALFGDPSSIGATAPACKFSPTFTSVVYPSNLVTELAGVIDASLIPQTIHYPETTATVTAAQWKNGDVFIINSAAQTLTLPQVTGLATGGNITIVTIGVTATLTPNSADGINGGAINTSVTLPADHITAVTTSGSSGTGALSVPLGPVQYFSLSWGASQDLSTPGSNGIPIGRVATPRTITGIRCKPTVVAGVAATFDVYSVSSGGTLGSGTKLNVTHCDANAGANAEQDMQVAVASIPAGYWIGIVASGWNNSVGWGAVNVSFR